MALAHRTRTPKGRGLLRGTIGKEHHSKAVGCIPHRARDIGLFAPEGIKVQVLPTRFERIAST